MSTSFREVIARLRNELVEADLDRRSNKQEALFELKNVDIELKFIVDESDEIKGGFDLKVVSFGAKDNYKQQEVQSVRITLGVVLDNSGKAPIGSRYSGSGENEEDVEEL